MPPAMRVRENTQEEKRLHRREGVNAVKRSPEYRYHIAAQWLILRETDMNVIAPSCGFANTHTYICPSITFGAVRLLNVPF
jgi:hypothetical protein